MKAKKAVKKEIGEFRKFISRGAVLDMAIGVIIGGAFSSIVTSLVNNILTPILGLVLGGIDFSNLSITFKDTEILYGAFIQSVIDFLIIAICIFVLVKIINKLMHFKKQEEEKAVPKKSDEVLLLEEIREVFLKHLD